MLEFRIPKVHLFVLCYFQLFNELSASLKYKFCPQESYVKKYLKSSSGALLPIIRVAMTHSDKQLVGRCCAILAGWSLSLGEQVGRLHVFLREDLGISSKLFLESNNRTFYSF